MPFLEMSVSFLEMSVSISRNECWLLESSGFPIEGGKGGGGGGGLGLCAWQGGAMEETLPDLTLPCWTWPYPYLTLPLSQLT